ncbi:MAG: NAD(P)/FAD-dependent oxidoreductase [Deltaproteobacteria bacterium]|nr:MAG: NAD(P)/FAD-dependent oxidoreductase [Deltaproteobacteria bacterium]
MMKDKYDVVIIGGGIAGLSTGLYLQKMGKRSIILEHGNQVGGNMSGIWRKGFYFDCGDQSSENVGVLFPILDELGLYNPDEWVNVRFRYATPDCDVMMYDYDQMREDYKKYFPESSAGIDKWFDYITPLCNTLKKMMGSGQPFAFAVDGWKKIRSNLSMIANSAGMAKASKEIMVRTGEEKALEYFPDDPRLAFLFGVGGAKNMLLMMHLFFWYAFTFDYWYPKAGLQGFLNKMADAYRERGGELRLKTTVDKVITSGKQVMAVETSEGERFAADYFVNTGNPKRLINDMLDNPNQWDYKDREVTIAAPVSVAVCSAFLGLDMDNEELKKYVKEHHTLYWRTYDFSALDRYDPDAHNKGWSMINATSFHLPHLAPEGKSSLVVQVFNSYHWQDGWGTGTDDPFTRSAKYKELKEKVLFDIIRETEYIIPGLSKKIVYKELATPRSMSRWTLNPEGSIMGWSYDSLQCHMAKKFTRFRTPFNNLFNAGHYSIWPGGVVFSAMSGRIVSKGIYGGFWRQLFI